MRIVSLLPSATEIVCALGLREDLVAVSGDCDYPPEVQDLPSVTASEIDSSMSSREIDRSVKENQHAGKSLYHLNEDRLESLNPDLVLTQEQCEVCAPAFDDVRDSCRILEGTPRVVSLEAHTLGDILDSVDQVGRLTDRNKQSDELITALNDRRRAIFDKVPQPDSSPRVLTLEWLDPPFVGGHWIPEMIRELGAVSFADPGDESRQVTLDDIEDYDPDITVLMPCGFGLDRTTREGTDLLRTLEARSRRSVLGREVYATNGSAYFSRPGPRVFDGLAILADILHGPENNNLSAPEGTVERLA